VSKLKKIVDAIKASGDEEAINILRKAVGGDDEYEGMSIVDDPNEEFEDDAAAEYIKEQEAKTSASPSKPQYSRDWKPSELSEQDAATVKQHMDDGYSEREAHRFAGTHKEHGDFQKALRSGLNPSMMSDRMIDQLKPLAKEWIDNADRNEKLNADINKNPDKFASGQMMQMHEAVTGDFSKDYDDFLGSDKVKDLRGRKRQQAIHSWKEQWHQDNPGYDDAAAFASMQQPVFKEAADTAKANLNDKMSHIMRGGMSVSDADTVNMESAQQHLGREIRGEDRQIAPGTEDITSGFAAKNPKLVSMLNQEHMTEHKDRLTRVDSHANAAGVVRRKKSEETE
jgi:hypothetical protein